MANDFNSTVGSLFQGMDKFLTTKTVAGGLGGKMTASAVLVIKDNQIRLVNVKNQDTITKVLDMVPDLIDRFQKKEETEESSEEVDTAVSDILDKE